MNKRPLCQAAVGFVLGVTFVLRVDGICLLAAFCVFGWMTVELLYKRLTVRWMAQGVLFWLLFLSGVFVSQKNLAKVSEYQSCIGSERQIICQGRIYKKENKNGQTIIFLKECIFQTESTNYSCNHILVYFDSDDYPIGKTIVVKGVLTPFREARNEGNFDEKSYYAAKKIDFKVTEAQVLGLYGKTNVLVQELDFLAENLRATYAECMTERNSGVMTGMVLGDKSLLNADVKSMYQKSGLGHVLCVSGLHLSVIGMTLYRFWRKRGSSYLFSGLFCGSIVFCFAVMSGFEVSAKRAVLMFILLLTANWIGRSYDSITALAAVVIFLLAENPFLIFYAGFLFSVGAVIGVVVVGERLVKGFEVKNRLAQNISVSLGIQLVTIPLTACYYYEIPVYAILINLLLLPFMGIILFCGILGGAAGIFSSGLAHVILYLPDLMLSGYEKVCSAFLGLPGAICIIGDPGEDRLMVYYIFLSGIVVLLGQRKRKTAVVGIFTALLILFAPKSRRMEIDVLDVGQGDGIYLCTKSGISMFIDGGSSDVSGVGTYRILPFLKAKGVKKISYWFVSHTDADHVNGLKEILESGYSIENIVFSEKVLQNEAYEKLRGEIQKQGIPVLFMEQGEKLQMEGDAIQCVFPSTDYSVEEANAGSTVLLYETEGFRGLLTGDISSEEETWMLEHEKLPELSFYKAAHHGSNYSNSEQFLNELSPEVCVVSCGLYNRYGHPGKEAVMHMEEASGDVFYTMEGGQIKIQMQEESFTVQKYTNPLEVDTYPMLK